MCYFCFRLWYVILYPKTFFKWKVSVKLFKKAEVKKKELKKNKKF